MTEHDDVPITTEPDKGADAAMPRLARWARGAERAFHTIFNPPKAPEAEPEASAVPVYPAGDLGEDNQGI